MDKKQIILNTEKFVKEKLLGEGSGHDWWHIFRVWNLAKRIAKNEDVDLFVVELAALLHDMADWKICSEGEEIGLKNVGKWLINQGLDINTIEIIKNAIEDVSYSRRLDVKEKIKSKVGEIIQDADRLDAMGAIGIARGFVFAGHKNLPIYDPDIKPVLDMKENQYKDLNRKSYTQINHFYEKLLLLKDLMNTETARKIAKKKHIFMEEYLKEFFEEWDGMIDEV